MESQTCNIKAVILVGSADFGRCPAASRQNRAMWPFAGRPVLQRLLDHLAYCGISKSVICCSSEEKRIQRHLKIPKQMETVFRFETFPRGPAGCIRDAADIEHDDLLLVMPAAILNLPPLEPLISAHRSNGVDMTVFMDPPQNPQGPPANARIYVCRPEIVKQIPQTGFFDIKENLIPAMIKAGQTVYAEQLQTPAGNFLGLEEYFSGVREFIAALPNASLLPAGYAADKDRPGVFTAAGVKIHPDVNITGPVLIGKNTKINPDVLIFGPAMIEDEVLIERGTVLSGSIVWGQARIESDCRIHSALIDSEKTVPAKSDIYNQMLVVKNGWID